VSILSGSEGAFSSLMGESGAGTAAAGGRLSGAAGGPVAVRRAGVQEGAVASSIVVMYNQLKCLENESIWGMCTNLSMLSIIDRFDSKFQIPNSRYSSGKTKRINSKADQMPVIFCNFLIPNIKIQDLGIFLESGIWNLEFM
jgi:hypothetical protein